MDNACSGGARISICAMALRLKIQSNLPRRMLGNVGEAALFCVPIRLHMLRATLKIGGP